MRADDSLATILLVGRLPGDGVRPLKASEFWKLCEIVVEPSQLLGAAEERLVADHGLEAALAGRVVALLDRATAMAFELERLGQAGISVLTPFDEHYPRRLVERVEASAPVLLYAAGAVDLLGEGGIGVVGSRDVSPEGAQVAGAAAELAARLEAPLISGGARGVDQIAMNTAFEAGGAVVGVLAESLMRKLRNADIRRAILAGRAVTCTPYSPEAPFSVGNAMGRNKLIYALSDLTVVVAADAETGGSWSGAAEALRRGFGRVAVWRGPGEGPGNAVLAERGAVPVTSLEELESALLEAAKAGYGVPLRGDPPSSAPESSLFD
ncbi:MAG: DNA-processing protein DprA [Acidimicrobiia bacterium]|nr:DNA-processing protein DprA [Acidimicrobiia bacterium]MYB25720.1 DNA-processing protein DprA [Acidimicrobiia bacterium]